jgi:hypothetical protein
VLGKDLVDRLSEAQGTVANREVERDIESRPPDVDEKLAPAVPA